MKVCAIVAEYNPFHNGHAYLINELKKQKDIDVFIAVMSGNFVERGEAAIIDKWERSKCAINNGIDLVLELPYIYATQSSTYFAKGAIDICKLANVDYIGFGSECANLDNLKEIASTPINPDHLHIALDSGMSYPKAYQLLTSEMYPNDILAVAYLKELEGSNIEPLIVARTNDYKGDKLDELCSANAIRNAIKNNEDISKATPTASSLTKNKLVYPEMYYPYLRTLLLTTPREQLQDIFMVSEGIEKLMIDNAKKCETYEEFINACTSYRYTASRIRRITLQIMNHITKEEVNKLPKIDSLRVLAFNETGKAWLHSKRKEEIKIASKFSKVAKPWREIEYRTSLLYTSVLSEEYRKRLIDLEIGGALYIKKD